MAPMKTARRRISFRLGAGNGVVTNIGEAANHPLGAASAPHCQFAVFFRELRQSYHRSAYAFEGSGRESGGVFLA